MTHLPVPPLLRQFSRLSRQEFADRQQAVRTLSAIRGLRFIDDRGRPRTIELALVPWILTPQQLGFFRQVARGLTDALLRLPHLYREHAAVRGILSLDPVQESWARLAQHPRSRPWAVLGRLDSTATFAHATWHADFEMLEPNAVGVGGIHYAPTACSVVLETFGDLLERAFPGVRMAPTPDPRQLLIDELAGVAKRIGARCRRVALIENADYTTGTDEFSPLARYLSTQGLHALVADPRELGVSRGRLVAKGLEIDFLYRDCELNEFVEMEAAGHRLTGLRQAIREGRMISGLLWEFDHKSSWEVFTDPAYARYFTEGQRRLFAAHLPWTRLVRPAMVRDPSGRRVDLPAYIRRHRTQLVLKPNTMYGGQGVAIGRAVTQRSWEQTLAKALRGALPYVVQRLARISTHPFPRPGASASVERRVVSGFFFNSSAIGLVGRFSDNPVVNVSRGGGLLSALMVQ